MFYDATHAYKAQRKVAETVDRKGVVAGGIILPTATARRMVGEGTGWKQWQPRTDDLWPIRHGFDTVPLVEIPNRPRLGRPDLGYSRHYRDAERYQSVVGLLVCCC